MFRAYGTSPADAATQHRVEPPPTWGAFNSINKGRKYFCINYLLLESYDCGVNYNGRHVALPSSAMNFYVYAGVVGALLYAITSIVEG